MVIMPLLAETLILPLRVRPSAIFLFRISLSRLAFFFSSLSVKYCILLIYLRSESGFASNMSEAKAQFISRSWLGFAMAMVRPLAMDITRKLTLMYGRLGRPNEMLESPQIVGSFRSSWQCLKVEMQALAALASAPIVATRPSTTISLGSTPWS